MLFSSQLTPFQLCLDSTTRGRGLQSLLLCINAGSISRLHNDPSIWGTTVSLTLEAEPHSPKMELNGTFL